MLDEKSTAPALEYQVYTLVEKPAQPKVQARLECADIAQALGPTEKLPRQILILVTLWTLKGRAL
jgi:hypothetical protein